MPIRDVIDSIKNNVQNAYTALEEQGANIPENKNIENLAETISGIKTNSVNSIEMLLPDEFGSTSGIYTMKISDNLMLYTSSTGTMGVWLYDIKDKTSKQVYTSDFACTTFQQVSETKWLLSGGSSVQGILLFDLTTMECVLGYSIGNYYSYFHQISETKWLISSASSSNPVVLVFDASTDEFATISTSLYSLAYCQKITENKILVSSANSSITGIYLINLTDLSLKSVWSFLYNWKYFQRVSDTLWWIGTSYVSTSSVPSAVVEFNPETDTCSYSEMNNSVGNSYQPDPVFIQVTDTKWLIGNKNSTGVGLFLFDLGTHAYTRLHNDSYYNTFQQVTDTKWLIGTGNSSTSSSYPGLLLFDSDTNTVKQIYGSRFAATHFFKLSEKRWGIGSRFSSFTGILVFDLDTEYCTKPFSTRYGWGVTFQVDSDRTLIIPAVLDSSCYGILLYKDSTKAITSLSTKGGYFDTFIEVEQGIVISASDKTKYKYSQIFEKSTEIVKLYGYYMEV